MTRVRDKTIMLLDQGWLKPFSPQYASSLDGVQCCFFSLDCVDIPDFIDIMINRNSPLPKCFRILTTLEFLRDKDEITRLCILSSYALRMGNLSHAWIVFHRQESLDQLNLTFAVALDDYSS